MFNLGRGEANEAITVMDYKESKDAVLYSLSAVAFHSLSSSVCVPAPFLHLSFGIEFSPAVHVLW